MFTTDTDIYQFIANDLGKLDDDWKKIILEVELDIEKDKSIDLTAIGYTGEYINSNGEKKWLLNNWEEDPKLDDAFRILYKIMTSQSDKHKWNRAKVTLTNDGKLNIKFEWDQELADELEALSKEYDPRWDDNLSQEEKEKRYKEMVKNGELPDLSNIEITYEEPTKT